MQAVEYGAFRYLSKPIEPEALREVVLRAIRLHQMAKLKRQALSMLGGDGLLLGDRAELEARFSHALEELWMAFQPIYSWKKKRVFGYEALVRTSEPTLARPSDLLLAAERLGRMRELSRSIRRHVAEAMSQAPEGVLIFTNIQSQDLEDDDLYGGGAPLTRYASRVVLEVTERASLDGIKDARGRAARLRDLGFRIAVDDLGAGYAGLSSFAILDPDVVKLDMSLVRGIDLDSRKKTVVRSMAKLAEELEMLVIPEGIETMGERDALLELGCDLFQGFLFARPEKGFAALGDLSVA
jgi:EAL domain-containing protein (putative c-di-GMP-specific phosphodiesterase class I)